MNTLFKVSISDIKLTQASYNSKTQIDSPKVYASLGFGLLNNLKLQAKISEVSAQNIRLKSSLFLIYFTYFSTSSSPLSVDSSYYDNPNINFSDTTINTIDVYYFQNLNVPISIVTIISQTENPVYIKNFHLSTTALFLED